MALKRFLVTRPLAQSESFAADLRARGFEALIAPLMTVQFFDPAPPVADYDGILITSANGAAALARIWRGRDVPVLAVGPQTADALRAAGFTAVTSADGDAGALAHCVSARVAPGSRLLHVTGRGGKPLSVPGYGVERLDAYDMVATGGLSDEATQALRSGALEGVFCFSPASAALFRDVVIAGGLRAPCADIGAYCISAAAAKMLKPLQLAYFRISDQPNRAALLATLPSSQAG